MKNPTYKEFKNIEWLDINLPLVRIYIKATQSNLIVLLATCKQIYAQDTCNLDYEDLYNLAKEKLSDFNFTTYEGEKVIEVNYKDIPEEADEKLVVSYYSSSYNLLILDEWIFTDF